MWCINLSMHNAHEKHLPQTRNTIAPHVFANPHSQDAKAVVKLSPYGTGLSVYFNNINAINAKSRVLLLLMEIYLFGCE